MPAALSEYCIDCTLKTQAVPVLLAQHSIQVKEQVKKKLSRTKAHDAKSFKRKIKQGCTILSMQLLL
jgi:hypothetical protein